MKSEAGNPTLTVAIPCYNGERFIGKSIEAILGQTTPADQILIVDDGSTDHSAQIAMGYPQVRLIAHGVNEGVAQARNTALLNALGDVILYVDVDAYADADLVSSLLVEYANHETAGVGGQGIEAVVETPYDKWRGAYASQSLGDKRCSAVWLPGICSSYRRTALLQVGGFDPLFRTNAEDVDIGIRLTAAGFRLLYTPDAKVYHHRQDDLDSLMSTQYRWRLWGNVALIKGLTEREAARLLAKRLLEAVLMGAARSTKRSLSDLSRGEAALAALHWPVLACRVRAITGAYRLCRANTGQTAQILRAPSEYRVHSFRCQEDSDRQNRWG